MSFFISEAWAEAAPAAAQPQGGSSIIVLMVLFFVAFYFILMRPQMKQRKAHQKLVESLSKGDEILTSGGLLGKVAELGENIIEVELADNVKVKVQRQAVVSVMPKGTLNSL